MENQNKFAEMLESLYKSEAALRDTIEKGIIEILKSNDLTAFRFKNPVCVSNNSDFSNDGKVFGVYLDVLSTDETHGYLVIEASWQASNFEEEEDYDVAEFYIDDLVGIYNQIFSEIE